MNLSWLQCTFTSICGRQTLCHYHLHSRAVRQFVVLDFLLLVTTRMQSMQLLDCPWGHSLAHTLSVCRMRCPLGRAPAARCGLMQWSRTADESYRNLTMSMKREP
jgi:hypothetical protein